jgi:hypothetical protein
MAVSLLTLLNGYVPVFPTLYDFPLLTRFAMLRAWGKGGRGVRGYVVHPYSRYYYNKPDPGGGGPL